MDLPNIAGNSSPDRGAQPGLVPYRGAPPPDELTPGYPVFFEPTGTDSDQLRATVFNCLQIVFKRRWLIAAVAAAVLLLGLVVTMLQTPMFAASATLQIDREAAKVVSEADDLQPGGTDAEFYQTQYELLRSRSLAERVVASLNLTDNPLLFAEGKQGLFGRMWSRLFGGTAAPRQAPDLAARQRTAANFVMAGLSVNPIKFSRLVEISFKSPNPALSQQIANAIADGFIAANLEHRFDASAYARKFLEDRLQQLKVKLEESDKALVAYAQQEQIVSVGDKQTTVAADLEAANTKLGDVRNTRIRNEQLWMQAKSTAGLGLSQILESPIVQKLRDAQADLKAEYQQKLNLFKPAYPEMVDLQSRIHELDTQIQAEVGNIKNSIKADYEASLSEEKAVETQVAGLKDQILNLKARSIQYNILERETDTNRQLYDGLLQRYKEIGVAGGVGTNNVSVVDRAQLPLFRSSPNLHMNLALSLVFGLAAGMMCAFGLEFLDDTLKSPEDVETKLGLPVLGVIPKFPGDIAASDLLRDPRSALSEAYRSLCTTLQFSTEFGLPRTIFITSTRPHEGKTTTALTLARNLAQLGQRVLLVDSDLRNPSLHRAVGCSNEAGLSNFLAGAARPPELLIRTDLPNLTFISSGPLPPNPADLLAGSKLHSFLSVGAEAYDAVIIDGPPIMGMADAPLLSNVAAGTLIVAAAGEARQGQVKHALKRLQLARANVLGVLLTKFDARNTGYHYAYGYGYAYGEGKPYGQGAAPQLTDAKDAGKGAAAA